MDHVIWTALNSFEEYAKENELRSTESEQTVGQVVPEQKEAKTEQPSEAARPTKQAKKQ